MSIRIREYIHRGRGYNRGLKPAEEIKHEKVYHKKTNGRGWLDTKK